MSSESSTHADDKSAWGLPQWLAYLESIHTKSIDMGLARIRQVADKLLGDWSDTTVITVAGTNGKGTTCALLEQACLAKHKSVAVYSSPHLFDYRERLRFNGDMLTAEQHCKAFLTVEQARGDTPLTYFEFSTLAAFSLITEFKPSVALLEIGLGGRLDAVNIVDPDIAVITSIDLDHQDWLGDTREAIGAEKAGIMRAGVPVVIGDPEPPGSVVKAARSGPSQALFNGDDFGYSVSENGWSWFGGGQCYPSLRTPNIPVQNASTALQVLQLLNLSLSAEELNPLLETTGLPGRFQQISSNPLAFADVAHNPQAVRYLKDKIEATQYTSLHLVVGMLADKDIESALAPLLDLQANWYPATLNVPRGADKERIKQVLVGREIVLPFDSVQEAYRAALSRATENDLIIVFGSFFTVADVLAEN